MTIRMEEWDTANNREAEGGSFTKGKTDISTSFMSDPADMEQENPAEDAAEQGQEEGENQFPLDKAQLMRLTKSAFSQGVQYLENTLQSRWTASYNAFNNKHAGDSKYSTQRFRGRSRLYRPKTRSTARKKQAEAAAALFSTSDAVLVKAMDESNPEQAAGAEVLGQLLRFRLDRANENSGIPWFQIAMGAHLSAQQTAICISKQYWEYRKELVAYEDVPVMVDIPPELQPMVGAPQIPTGETKRTPKYKIVRDRPRCELMPPEDVIRDPSASWEDQAQDSAYLILRFPMTVEAAKTFLSSANDKSRVKFIDLKESELAAAAGIAADATTSANVRRAREHGGTDRYSDFSVDNAYSQVALHENFFRIDGHDYCFWTLGIDKLISEVIPVEEAYPEQGGGRPIVIGIGALEPFKIDPMAPVEAWQELQREMNDLVNLRLDALKQNIAPLAKVKRGRSVDVRAIQNRSPDSVVFLQDMTDLEFDRPASISGESYIEMEKLNADFDDQAGNFSTGSVQTNRQLGETVGGMQMMQSNANALGEFDLRVWVETWVEPVLRQIVKLEQFYESDENVIAVSAKRAKLFQKFGEDAVTDAMLTSQVAISVDLGLGSSDPMMALQKFQQASQITMGVLGPNAQSRMKQNAVIDEVYGKAGYKDASDRFFNPTEEEDQRIQQMGQQMQEMQKQLEEMGKALKDKQGEMETRIRVAQLGALGGLAKQEMTQQHQAKQTFIQAATGQIAKAQDQNFQREQGDVDRQFQTAQGDQQRAHAMDLAQAKQPPMPPQGGAPMPPQGGPPMLQEQESPQENAMEGPQPQPQSIHEMLGLTPPPPPQDPAATMAPIVQALLQGLQQMAQQQSQQTMLLARQMQAQTAALIDTVERGNQRIEQVMSAPKVVLRNPDNTIRGVATDLRS